MAGFDLVICGGGPAGLATAIAARQAGLTALVLERAGPSPDKACGEGLMPDGLRALRELGALELIEPSACAPFHGIRYLLGDGRSVEGRFRRGDGLGVRRTALSAALESRARALGVELRRASLEGFEVSAEGVAITTARGRGDEAPETIDARLLVGADGLQSKVRRLAGLDAPAAGPRRFGLRRHFSCVPWSDLVEVHWADGVECYVTPAGARRVNVAFLWDDDLRGKSATATAGAAPEGVPEKPGFETLLARFPAVAARLAGAEADSEVRGCGPLSRPVRARASGRVALVGDAAGYVDAITGQGLSLAFRSAQALIAALVAGALVPANVPALPGPGPAPRTLDPAALPAALRRYHLSLRRPWLRYAIPARALLLLAGGPWLRRVLLGLIARSPRLFGLLLGLVG